MREIQKEEEGSAAIGASFFLIERLLEHATGKS